MYICCSLRNKSEGGWGCSGNFWTGGSQKVQPTSRCPLGGGAATAPPPPALIPYPPTYVLGAAAGGGKVDSRPFVPPDRQCYFCRENGHEAWQCAKKREYLAKKAQQHKHHPVQYQPGYYPHGYLPPVAAPVVPWPGFHWGPVHGGVGKKGKGKKGKNGGKGKGAPSKAPVA